MPLVEYLYVDEKRLDAYFEQISPPVAYDKVPMWNAEIGFTGPKAGGAQQRFARPYSTHEKIIKLTEHLEQHGLAEYERVAHETVDEKEVFRLETCQARRVFIPTKQLDSNADGLSLWVSLRERGSSQTRSKAPFGYGRRGQPGNLYLLEDFRDADTPFVTMFSGLSVLNLLLEGLSWAGYLSSGASRYDDLPDLDLSAPGDAGDSLGPYRRELREFSTNPAVALSQLGAQVGAVRKIRCLYRVRVVFRDTDSEPQFRISTFGYPIYIAEVTDTV